MQVDLPTRTAPPVTKACGLFFKIISLNFFEPLGCTRYPLGFSYRSMVPYVQVSYPVWAMFRYLLHLTTVCLTLWVGAATAKTAPTEDVDLHDILGASVLAVPPTSKLQPLRVRQAKSPLSVDGRPQLLEDANKNLFVTIDVQKFGAEPIVLTVVEGLVLADHLGQTYIPIPRRFKVTQRRTEVRLDVVASSPSVLVPEENRDVGFVGQYNETLGQAFRALDRILNAEFPAVLNRLEQVNGHWKFKRKAPNRGLLQWLRWIEVKESGGRAVSVSLSNQFWRYLVWSILEDYNVQDFASWLQATSEISAEYAAVDALELTDGLKFFLRSEKLNADVLGPGTYAFFYNQGVRAFKSSDYSEAESFFREALRINGTKHDAHFNLGLTLYRRHDYEGAAQAWLVGSGLPGASAEVFYHRGVALLRLEMPIKAAKMFRKALMKAKNHKQSARWLRIADPDNKTKPSRTNRRRRR
jgi:tetratricopeptide (TPR) repeat protein